MSVFCVQGAMGCVFEGVGVYYLWGCAHGWWDLVGLRTPHVWGPCQRPQWCRRARRCSHTYVETMILHAVMCGWLWRMAELATRGCCCLCNVCARGMCGGGWWCFSENKRSKVGPIWDLPRGSHFGPRLDVEFITSRHLSVPCFRSPDGTSWRVPGLTHIGRR